jgi:hypothetical protein
MKKSKNLLKPEWSEIDSADLRLLLESRIGSPGQYTGDPGDDRLFLPLFGNCRVILKFEGNRVSLIEPGNDFNEREWARVSADLDALGVARPNGFGSDFAFSLYHVGGWWRGARSGVQILPPPALAPTMSKDSSGQHPFVLEVPLTKDREWNVTNRRRLREHRRIALLLNVLLAGRVNVQPVQTKHAWAIIGQGANLEWIQIGQENWPRVEWVQCSYMAKLDSIVSDEPSAPSGDSLEVLDPDSYYMIRGLDGKGLRVPADLDESICAYQSLNRKHRERFDRALIWLDLASEQWTTSMSASFASLVSAVEALVVRGVTHTAHCRQCGTEHSHDSPSVGALFQGFFERYAPGKSFQDQRDEMYSLRSGILHGGKLIAFDEGLAMGWDPPWRRQNDLHGELWSLTRIALRNYLRDPPLLTRPRAVKRPAGAADRFRQFLHHPITSSRPALKALSRRIRHAVRRRLWALKNRGTTSRGD